VRTTPHNKLSTRLAAGLWAAMAAMSSFVLHVQAGSDDWDFCVQGAKCFAEYDEDGEVVEIGCETASLCLKCMLWVDEFKCVTQGGGCSG
jgi:hypothetical protein